MKLWKTRVSKGDVNLYRREIAVMYKNHYQYKEKIGQNFYAIEMKK